MTHMAYTTNPSDIQRDFLCIFIPNRSHKMEKTNNKKQLKHYKYGHNKIWYYCSTKHIASN